MTEIKKIIPKHSIQSLVSYRPDVMEEISKKQIRLSVNEGAFGIGPNAKKAIEKWYKEYSPNFHRYPFQINQNLVNSIAERYNLISQNIVPGNGSDELIQLLCHAFLEKDDEAIYTEYGFLVFPQSIKISGGIPVMAQDENFTISIKGIIEKINKKTKIIFIANPNNPTGTMVSETDLSNLISNIPKNIILIIDSAYAEYVCSNNYCDGAKFVESNNNIVMLRTFSKIHGLASFRLGWAYCSQQIANILKSIRAPFSVNTLAGFIGSQAIKDEKFEKKSFLHNRDMMQFIQKKLQLAKIKVLPSVANFFLIDFNSELSAMKVMQYLQSKNIFVREMKPYNLPSCLRISIGNKKEMNIFCNEIINYKSEENL